MAQGSSIRSSWNLRCNPNEEALRQQLFANAGDLSPGQRHLLRIVAREHCRAIQRLREAEWQPVPFVPTTFGIRPALQRPGRLLLHLVRQRWQVRPKPAVVQSLKRRRGVFVLTTQEGTRIEAEVLIVATGGSRKGAVRSDGTRRLPDVVQMVEALGGTYDPKGVMRHPFFLDDPRLPSALVSGFFITRAEFFVEDGAGQRHPFLPPKLAEALRDDDYHHLFPELTRAFEAAQRRGRIVMRSLLSREEYERFVRHNEYGHLFRHLPYGPWLERIPLRVADHYSLGGLVPTERCEVVGLPRCFVLGEAMALYGGRRLGGMGHTDGIVLAPTVARAIRAEVAPRVVALPCGGASVFRRGSRGAEERVAPSRFRPLSHEGEH